MAEPVKEIPRIRRPSIFVQMLKWLVALAVIGGVAYWWFYKRG